MGMHQNITLSKFPEQGDWLGKRTNICFHFDTKNQIQGTIVRDDREEPGICIIRLDDGRHVLTTECQHTLPK